MFFIISTIKMIMTSVDYYLYILEPVKISCNETNHN